MKHKNNIHRGLHIVSTMTHCTYDFSKEKELPQLFKKYCEEVGLTVVGLSEHTFEPQGITFTILLAESHVCVHTWPEDKTVYVDVFTCNHEMNNEDKAKIIHQKMKRILSPYTYSEQFIQR